MVLFRTWLFVPGNQRRRINKAKELTVDVLVYDLEDSVALGEKDEARNLVKRALEENRGIVSFVRINDFCSPYFSEDIKGVVCAGLSGIVLPKATKKEHIVFADYLLTQHEQKHKLKQGSIEIMPLIESAHGLYRAYDLATASKRVRRLAFGAIDYALDINAQLTKEGTEILYVRSQLVVVSRVAGIEAPIDTVYVNIQDKDGLEQETRLAKQLGFQGKLVIHPAQIDIVNGVYTPTKKEIEEAKAIIAAFDKSLAKGLGSVQLDGKMIDYPVVERAKKLMGQLPERAQKGQ